MTKMHIKITIKKSKENETRKYKNLNRINNIF